MLIKSLAILRHLGRTHGLVPKTEAEWIRVDVAEQQFIDFRGGFNPKVITTTDLVQLRRDYTPVVAQQLQQTSAFLGARKYVAGEDITYVDFLVYDVLEVFQQWSPASFNGLDNLKAYMNRIGSYPKLKAYLASPGYEHKKIVPNFATWGYSE